MYHRHQSLTAVCRFIGKFMELMVRKMFLIGVLISLISGCGLSPAHQPQQIEREIPLAGVGSLAVDLERGHLVITGMDRENLKIVSSATNQPSRTLSTDQNELKLVFETSTRDQVIQLFLPDDLALSVETFSAQIEIFRFTGSLEIHSAAGDIRCQEGRGDVLLRSGRGDVRVVGGEGALTVLGQHGIINVDQFIGSASLSTIMGKIDYHAPVVTSGPVHLETDHGAVDVVIPDTSSYRVEAASTSGVLQCVGSQLESTLSGCEGSYSSGEFPLQVRTVSGRIYIQEISGSQDEAYE